MKDKFFDKSSECLKNFSLWVLRNILWVVIVSPIIVFMAFVLATPDCNGEYARWICNRLGVKEQREAIQMLGVSLIAVLGIYMANRRAVARDKIAEAQAKTVEGDKERRIQERFRDAIKLLGHEKESIRYGGAYALFHLALEKESLRQSIAEILCAHIRGVTRSEGYKKDYRNQPSMEIQSLMALLFEEINTDRTETLKRFWKGISPPDLSEGYFRGLDLKEARFQGVNFYKTQFKDAKFRGAKFHRANLDSTDFQGATLDRAGFLKAHIEAAKFRGSYLRQVKFQGAMLAQACFQGAVFESCVEFQEADLWGAQFQGVYKFHFVFSGREDTKPLTRRVSEADFKEQIWKRKDKEQDLRGAVFAGGLDEERINSIAKELESLVEENEIVSFRKALEEHLDPRELNREEVHKLLLGKRAEIGAYSQDDAEKWIAEPEQP